MKSIIRASKLLCVANISYSPPVIAATACGVFSFAWPRPPKSTAPASRDRDAFPLYYSRAAYPAHLSATAKTPSAYTAVLLVPNGFDRVVHFALAAVIARLADQQQHALPFPRSGLQQFHRIGNRIHNGVAAVSRIQLFQRLGDPVGNCR